MHYRNIRPVIYNSIIQTSVFFNTQIVKRPTARCFHSGRPVYQMGIISVLRQIESSERIYLNNLEIITMSLAMMPST